MPRADVIRFACAVPDTIDEFLQVPLRSAMGGVFGQAFPTWRSVAIALGWQQSSAFSDARLGPGDVVVCLDPTSDALSAIFLVARHHGRLKSEYPASARRPKSLGLRCVQNGPPARRKEGAYLKRYVTDEQRSRRPHFQRNPVDRGRLAVFPRCSLLTYRSKYARRWRLEKQPTELRRNQRDLGDGTLVRAKRS
jgi:hypothetical protein